MLWESCHTKKSKVFYKLPVLCVFLVNCHSHHCFPRTNFLRSFKSNAFSGAYTIRFFLETFGPLLHSSRHQIIRLFRFIISLTKLGVSCVCVCVRRQGVGWSRRTDARIGKDAPLVYWTRNRVGACNRLSKPGDFAFFFQGRETRGSKTSTHLKAVYVRQPGAASQAMDALLALL